MPYVLVTTVQIADVDKARDGLHAQVIPMAKQAPGFMRGTWAADREGGRGIGFQVFETREHADAVAVMLRSPDGSPVPEGVSIETTTVYELMGEA